MSRDGGGLQATEPFFYLETGSGISPKCNEREPSATLPTPASCRGPGQSGPGSHGWRVGSCAGRWTLVRINPHLGLGSQTARVPNGYFLKL